MSSMTAINGKRMASSQTSEQAARPSKRQRVQEAPEVAANSKPASGVPGPPRKHKKKRDALLLNPGETATLRRLPAPKPRPRGPGVSSSSGQPSQASAANAARELVKRGLTGKSLDGAVAPNKGKKTSTIMVSRKTKLGNYIRRCKELLVDMGYSQIILLAMAPAIPHALILLQAVLDILPYPRSHVRHSIRTASVECFDEVTIRRPRPAAGAVAAESETEVEQPDLPFELPGAYDEEEGGLRSRLKSTMEITISVGTASRATKAAKVAGVDQITQQAVRNKRPSKSRRNKLKRRTAVGVSAGAEGSGADGEMDILDGSAEADVIDFDEEAMMNEAV